MATASNISSPFKNLTVFNQKLCSVHTLTNSLNTLQINQQQQTCASTHTQDFAIEFPRRRDHVSSTLRTFCTLKTCVQKRARQEFSQHCVKLCVNKTSYSYKNCSTIQGVNILLPFQSQICSFSCRELSLTQTIHIFCKRHCDNQHVIDIEKQKK